MSEIVYKIKKKFEQGTWRLVHIKFSEHGESTGNTRRNVKRYNIYIYKKLYF